MLRANVTALITAAEVESAIDPVRNEGTDRERHVEVDWQLRLIGRSGFEAITQRRETVACRMEKRGRRWTIVRLDPPRFFAPPVSAI